MSARFLRWMRAPGWAQANGPHQARNGSVQGDQCSPTPPPPLLQGAKERVGKALTMCRLLCQQLTSLSLWAPRKYRREGPLLSLLQTGKLRLKESQQYARAHTAGRAEMSPLCLPLTRTALGAPMEPPPGGADALQKQRCDVLGLSKSQGETQGEAPAGVPPSFPTLGTAGPDPPHWDPGEGS